MDSGVELPNGMHVDHICRNRLCVRPDHLRVVTPKVNALQNSEGHAASNVLKTHCPRGHPYDDKNTIVRRRAGQVFRVCRTCATILRRESKARCRIRDAAIAASGGAKGDGNG